MAHRTFISTRVPQKAAENETKRERLDEAKIIIDAGNYICVFLLPLIMVSCDTPD